MYITRQYIFNFPF